MLDIRKVNSRFTIKRHLYKTKKIVQESYDTVTRKRMTANELS